MRPKGKLVVPRKGKKLGPDVTLKRAADSARNKLGLKTFQNLQANYSSLSTASNRKRKRFEDGMLMTLLQQNLSNGEIRSVFNITAEDLKALKEHLSTFETEDGFPALIAGYGSFLLSRVQPGRR